MRVAVFVDPRSPRSRRIADAMAAGLRKHGEATETWNWGDVVTPENHRFADVAVGYGWGHPALLKSFPRLVHVDLGWWNRKPVAKPLDGYHKVSVNARDPSSYFRKGMGDGRFLDTCERPISPWRREGSGPILIAGMSAKSAGTYNLLPEEWEERMIRQVQAFTTRGVLYRPKPSWLGARPLPGALYVDGSDIGAILKNHAVHAVVTHHSNVAVDALIAGIPFHVEERTVVHEFSTPLHKISAPDAITLGDRVDLLGDLAYCQWTPDEMASGACWAHLKEFTSLCA